MSGGWGLVQWMHSEARRRQEGRAKVGRMNVTVVGRAGEDGAGGGAALGRRGMEGEGRAVGGGGGGCGWRGGGGGWGWGGCDPM